MRGPLFSTGVRLSHVLDLGAIALAVLLLAAPPASAEICWAYTDTQLAKVPLKCVRIGDPSMGCSWSPFCNTDNDPSDCCMAVYDPTAVGQTVGQMHIIWHQCLGNTGTSASPPPPNRGLRWFAFHRQFESDFNVYRESIGLDKIDSLEWCPGMNMPYGHFGAGLGPGDHPLGCGTGINRPDDTTCDGCETFRPCLYLNGAGPVACPAPALPVCTVGTVSFPYTTLDQFQNADQIGTLLDVFFHAEMHGDVADADGGGYNGDCGSPDCSPRDPMFWRLHKALDDVMRAWQDVKAVDVTLVIDRSGSMSAASGTGVGTRLQNAVEAADMFGDLLEDLRSDGGVNRIGIVSYSSNASNPALNMTMEDVTSDLRNPLGPFITTLNALSPGGSTSIGSGVVGALEQLCTAGNCATHVFAPGENERKAMLLLTDGKENTAPCLEAGCEPFGGGAEIDYTKLDVTQVCAVGLGNAASINGELLTIFAERQGGIYMNNTDATGNDLKDFFAKCFAQLTDEFIGLDPAGTIATSERAGPIVPYESCDDERVTFTAGWNRNDVPGDHLTLLVTSPAGDAWVPQTAGDEMSTERKWAFKRSPLPWNGQAEGTWTMQLLRPQEAFVNGFTTDSFVDPAQGQRFVRRQIQRLCPVDDSGHRTCERVLYFEKGALGPSVYAAALTAETGVTVGTIVAVTDANALNARLQEAWDLIVYARQGNPNSAEVYDATLARVLCGGTRAIVTDTRSVSGAAGILSCAGAVRNPQIINLPLVRGLENFLPAEAGLTNPGHAVFSYGVQSVAQGSGAIDAIFPSGSAGPGAIVGKARLGSEINWHKNVLVTGLSRLTAFPPRTVVKTGEAIKAAVKILPSFQRAGGYPGSRMTVEVERPTVGLGSIVKRLQPTEPVGGDPVSSLEQQIGKVSIPTRRDVFDLNDQGKSGDTDAFNGTFSANLPISAAVDGMYTFHYRFEYPAGPCRARRELKQSLYVVVKVSPDHSSVQVGEPKPDGKTQVYPVSMTPRDALGNVVGPGRSAKASCASPCACANQEVVDHGDGRYTIPLRVPDGVDLSSCEMDAFGAHFQFGKRAQRRRGEVARK